MAGHRTRKGTPHPDPFSADNRRVLSEIVQRSAKKGLVHSSPWFRALRLVVTTPTNQPGCHKGVNNHHVSAMSCRATTRWQEYAALLV